MEIMRKLLYMSLIVMFAKRVLKMRNNFKIIYSLKSIRIISTSLRMKLNLMKIQKKLFSKSKIELSNNRKKIREKRKKMN